MRLKNTILYSVIGFILFVVAFVIFRFDYMNDNFNITATILSIIGNLVIILFFLIGFFEFAYKNNLTFLVPDPFIENKKRRLSDQARLFIEEYLKKEIGYLKKHGNERVEHILSVMGLNSNGFTEIKHELIKTKLQHIKSIDTAQEKLKQILFTSGKVFDLHQEGISFEGERYYFKFADLMHERNHCEIIVEIMTLFIQHTLCRQRLDNVDVCMVPHSSNYLLGFETSKKLFKKFIKMIPVDKIIADFTYEGKIDKKNNLNVIIIHDILFTSKQVSESIDLLKRTIPSCVIVGVFCLVYRNIHDGKKKLTDIDIDVHHLLEFSEEEITRELERNYDLLNQIQQRGCN